MRVRKIMSVNYTIFVYDDFDWNYANTDKPKSKQKLLDDLLEVGCPADVLADFRHYIVLDLHKKYPLIGDINKILMKNDMIYYSSCHDPTLIRLEKE